MIMLVDFILFYLPLVILIDAYAMDIYVSRLILFCYRVFLIDVHAMLFIVLVKVYD